MLAFDGALDEHVAAGNTTIRPQKVNGIVHEDVCVPPAGFDILVPSEFVRKLRDVIEQKTHLFFPVHVDK